MLIEQEYYLRARGPGTPNVSMLPFMYFCGYLQSLHRRNNRLKLRRLSIMSDILMERAKRRDITFSDIMQADFVLFIKSYLYPFDDDTMSSRNWMPHTLLYVGPRVEVFEIFARSQSKKYFDSIKRIIGADNKEVLENLIVEFQTNKRNLPSWEFESFSPGELMAIDKIASKP